MQPTRALIAVATLGWACSACNSTEQVAIADGGGDPRLDVGLPDGVQLFGCTGEGTPCNAHDPCAINPQCSSGLCVPQGYQNCADDLTCTRDTCLGQGKCSNQPEPGRCALSTTGAAGEMRLACFSGGDVNPANACQICEPAQSAVAWSAASGTRCDDANSCTKDDRCQAGTCKGTYYGEECQDTLACTDDLCDGSGGCAGNPVQQDACVIDGTCYAANDDDASGCNACTPNKSQTAWTPLEAYCLIEEHCYQPGANDLTGCGVCDPTKNDKGFTPVAGKCLIVDQCYAANDKDATACRLCDPTTDAESWTVMSGAKQQRWDFESGQAAGFSINNSDAKVGWVVSKRRAYASSHALYYGDAVSGSYKSSGDSSNGTFVTPEVLLTAGKTAGAAFLLYMDTKLGGNFDKLIISVLDGTSKTTVWEKAATGPTAIQPQQWREFSIDLSAYAGKAIRLEFKFDTVSNWNLKGEGVFVDEIAIVHSC